MIMSVPKDEAREERIRMEIVVDAYNSDEQAVGWYYYPEGTLQGSVGLAWPMLFCGVRERWRGGLDAVCKMWRYKV
jgi:hypothetical protein